MHERYIRFINERYFIASPHTIKQMKDIIRILPADPDDITREWVIFFYSSNSTLQSVAFL